MNRLSTLCLKPSHFWMMVSCWYDLCSRWCRKNPEVICSAGGLSATGQTAVGHVTEGHGRVRFAASAKSSLQRRRTWRTSTAWHIDRSSTRAATISPVLRCGFLWIGLRWEHQEGSAPVWRTTDTSWEIKHVYVIRGLVMRLNKMIESTVQASEILLVYSCQDRCFSAASNVGMRPNMNTLYQQILPSKRIQIQMWIGAAPKTRCVNLNCASLSHPQALLGR